MQIKDEQSGESCSNADHKLAELPKVWVWTKLAEIGEINPKLMDEYSREDIEVTFLPMKCVQELTGKLDLSYARKLSQVRKGYTPFIDGDLLFAKITPCMENGKVAIAHSLKNGIGFGSTEFHVIRLPESFPKKFFFYYLIRADLRRDAQRNMTGSAGQLRVPANYMQQIPIPLPPLHEQHRIVARIEELFTRLDAGVEALKKIKAQLRRYRQSVLNYALEGKLTEEWRHAHRGEIERSSVLVGNIEKEQGKKAKGKTEELPEVEASDLPELPGGWVWSRIGEIGEVETGTTPPKSKPEYYGKDYRFYKPTDLNAGYYTRNSQDGLSSLGLKKARLLPECSVLVTCIGATIGKTGFIRREGASNQQINAIIPYEGLCPQYVYFICISPQFQRSIIQHASATTLPILSKRKFETLLLPIPPNAEQGKIVEEIEHRFSIADEIEKTVDRSLKQAERLRQSILKRGFEGKLVPQDPNDEPAGKLLERIREDRAKQKATAQSAKVSKKRVTIQEMRLM